MVVLSPADRVYPVAVVAGDIGQPVRAKYIFHILPVAFGLQQNLADFLLVLVDGQYMNPLYFADTGDTSERHLPEAGAGGGGNYFDYDVPPEALADEKFAAMLAEAEKYLGYPYVW